MDGPGPVETFRWKGARRRFLGADLPRRDAEGAARAEAEGGWLAVVYPKDRAKAYVETVERAEATRSFSTALDVSGRSRHEAVIMTAFELDSVVGAFAWEADVPFRRHPASADGARTNPFFHSCPGTLTLPTGVRRRTECGSGFFDVVGLVHAYQPWRDSEVAGGWTAITEVSLDAPDELRPLLAALPLLLFTSPPGLFD